MQPIKRRLDRIEASIAQMEPEIPRRHLTAQEQIELDTLTREAPGGDPFGHPFEKAMKWKHLHFIAHYGLTVSELRKTPMKGSLAQALQKSKEMMS